MGATGGAKEFPTIKDIIKSLKESSDGRSPILKDCLHPSEFDKADTLLLCRSMAKLKADMIGKEASSSTALPKVVVPFNQLSKFEEKRFQGKFTNVWKCNWTRGKDVQVVSMSQMIPGTIF